jgi:phosphopantothenoylcysteine decarboxylase/phosphopantothenate--cysteine ligase
MLAACEASLPVDIAICTAAVADWRPEIQANSKIKKAVGDAPQTAPSLSLVENPDILATLSRHASRPPLVIGFAAETDDLERNARDKRLAKGCDWIVANDVGVTSPVMGGDKNTIHLVTASGDETWPELEKSEVAARLVKRIAAHFGKAA